jgi:hypothetical protein
MSIAFYLDENMPRAIAIGLRVRGVDVLTAQEDNHRQTDDSILLDRAGALSRVMVSFDADMLAIGTRRQRENIPFSGIIYAHPTRISVGDILRELELIAEIGKPEDLANTIFYLPL